MLPIVKINGKDYWRYTKWVSKKKAVSARGDIKKWLAMKGKLEVLEHPKRKGYWAAVMRLSGK